MNPEASVVPEPSRATEVTRLELSRLAPDTPLAAVFATACERAADALNVERVGVWLFIDDDTALRCVDLFERSKREHSHGAVLRVADFPTYFASLSIRKAVPSEIASHDPWTAELAAAYLKPLGISSMLDAGIFVDGKLVGVLCNEHVGPPREWTTEARDFAGGIADLLALRIQSAKARELRDAFLTQQDRLIEQDKTAALEQLAAGLAHDFKNLLTAIVGYGYLIENRRDLPAEVCDQARDISSAAERGIALATELMQFARRTTKPPTVIDLASATTELVPVLQAAVGAQHPIDYFPPATLGQVLIDRTMYSRILLNLVVNARDAMPKGGTIDLKLSSVRLQEGNNPLGNFVLLEVRDHGIGMDEATQRKAFEPYFSTKSAGTGLGLAIVRQAIDRSGGFIRIESRPGDGTTFRGFFPRIGASTGGTQVFFVPPELRQS